VFAWLIGILTLVVSVEVFKRYILNAPTRVDLRSRRDAVRHVVHDVRRVHALVQDGHVRGDFLYSNMQPRTQAWLDLALYVLFFLPGIVALIYAGWASPATRGASTSIPT
jgi:TRAP-type mannitol/chloroaromatic compound transport system permease small subunit